MTHIAALSDEARWALLELAHSRLDTMIANLKNWQEARDKNHKPDDPGRDFWNDHMEEMYVGRVRDHTLWREIVDALEAELWTTVR
jgi:hypothetical protein